jgi:hypothetical protein
LLYAYPPFISFLGHHHRQCLLSMNNATYWRGKKIMQCLNRCFRPVSKTTINMMCFPCFDDVFPMLRCFFSHVSLTHLPQIVVLLPIAPHCEAFLHKAFASAKRLKRQKRNEKPLKLIGVYNFLTCLFFKLESGWPNTFTTYKINQLIDSNRKN